MLSEFAGARSVRILPRRFCPAASLAVREKKPYIELFRRGMRTAVYEAYIQSLRTRLESGGAKVDVFSKWPPQFVVCMWSAARRRDLARRATTHDAVVVLGCDAAVETARSAIEPTGCRVIPGMEVEGIINVIPTVRFPFNVSLEVVSVTRVLEHQG